MKNKKTLMEVASRNRSRPKYQTLDNTVLGDESRLEGLPQKSAYKKKSVRYTRLADDAPEEDEK